MIKVDVIQKFQDVWSMKMPKQNMCLMVMEIFQ